MLRPMQATPHSAASAPIRSPQPSSSARRWAVLALLVTGIIIAYVVRENFSVALATKDFTSLFRITDSDRGGLNAAFYWSYAFLQIPAGWLVDRYGVKFPYALGFLSWSLMSAGTSLATSASQLFGIRFLFGVGESVVASATQRWILLHLPQQQP